MALVLPDDGLEAYAEEICDAVGKIKVVSWEGIHRERPWTELKIEVNSVLKQSRISSITAMCELFPPPSNVGLWRKLLRASSSAPVANSTLKRGVGGIPPSAQPGADITDGGAAQIQLGCSSKYEDGVRGWALLFGSILAWRLQAGP